MAQENTISVSFTEAELTQLKNAIADIASVLQGKAISLTPSERQTFGRVKYEKEIWIDKVKNQMDGNADKIPSYIDKAEFDRDYTAHKQLNEVLTLLEQQLNLVQDTNLLLGYDLDVCALMFYRAIKVAATNNDPGARTIYEALKVQFPGNKKSTSGTTKGGSTP